MNYLENNVWFKVNYQTTHKILLDITSLVNTCLIFYFLYSILFKIIIPHVEKVWNYIINMLKGRNNKNNSFNSDNNPEPDGNPNPDKELDGVISEQQEKPKKTVKYIKRKQKVLDPEERKIKDAQNKTKKGEMNRKRRIEYKFAKKGLQKEERYWLNHHKGK